MFSSCCHSLIMLDKFLNNEKGISYSSSNYEIYLILFPLLHDTVPKNWSVKLCGKTYSKTNVRLKISAFMKTYECTS